MAANFVSRLLPSSSDDNFPEAERHLSQGSDTDDANDMAIDEENLREPFQDQDLEQLLAEAAGSGMITEKSMSMSPTLERHQRKEPGGGPSRITPKWMQSAPRRGGPQAEEYDDVPESLMLEHQRDASPELDRTRRRPGGDPAYDLPPPVSGPTTGNTRAQWENTRRQQNLHEPILPPPVTAPRRPARGAPRPTIVANPKDQAAWRWANIENLDNFLEEVYNYYDRKGIWSIVLNRAITLM